MAIDVPAWLRSLRLHKYNPIFETMKWQEMIRLDDEALSVKGVAALGARRKMLKVFDQVKQHCDKNVRWFSILFILSMTNSIRAWNGVSYDDQLLYYVT